MSDNLTPADLDIDPSTGSPVQLYRWLLASLLFGRRIQQEIAAQTYRTLIDHGFTSPARFSTVGREQLRRILDEGGYARFDYIMTDELRDVMPGLADEYGSVHHLVASSADRDELIERLTAFTGIGPVTARIFADAMPSQLYGTAQPSGVSS
ncbi:hypothetical protein ACUWEX_08990 [Okibacterium fritillariae]|uniref:hypothetical protein n=1 Tax=Okibacterium fritillariae TaxID=123320 RepID=UPI0040558559